MEVVQDHNTPFYINVNLYKNRECKQLTPGGPIPHNMAYTFDGPPTLERSGSEHRRAITSFLLRFLPPTRGTEGGVKTIKERLGEKGRAFFNGKEGRDDLRNSY